MKTYVINLARNKERMQNMERQLGILAVPFERFDACDGYALPEDNRHAAEKARPLGVWNTPGHIGCLFSHRALWKKIAEGAEAYACVLEDDIHIARAVAKLLKCDSNLPKDFDLIRLEWTENRVLLGKKPLFTEVETGVSLYRLYSSSFGTAAYIISRTCARKMMELPENKQRTSDYILFDVKASPADHLVIYQFSPAVVIQDKCLADQERRLNFSSNLDDNAPPRPRMGILKALWKGRFSYVLRILRGYRDLPYLIEN